MNQAQPQLVLMGLRGSGKTTLGKVLAARLSRPLIDLDDLVAQRGGTLAAGGVAALWARVGQAGFRALEVEALKEVLGKPGTILALGGGTPTAPGAAELLSAAGHSRGSRAALLIYLRAEPATLKSRLEATDVASRPSLTGAGTLAEVDSVFAQRDPAYTALADELIEAGTIDEMAKAIARLR